MTREILEQKTKVELHTIAKELKIENYEMLNKQPLIESILNAYPNNQEEAKDESVTPEKKEARQNQKQPDKTVGAPKKTSVVLQYNGAFRGTLTKYGKTWTNVARREVSREEADLLMNEFPGRFTIVR